MSTLDPDSSRAVRRTQFVMIALMSLPTLAFGAWWYFDENPLEAKDGSYNCYTEKQDRRARLSEQQGLGMTHFPGEKSWTAEVVGGELVAASSADAWTGTIEITEAETHEVVKLEDARTFTARIDGETYICRTID